MDAETVRWIIGLIVAIVIALCATMFHHLRERVEEVAKRTHRHASQITALKGRISILYAKLKMKDPYEEDDNGHDTRQ